MTPTFAIQDKVGIVILVKESLINEYTYQIYILGWLILCKIE